MSSRVGTAIPASPSTAWSSSAVGLTMSIQTALCGSAARSGEAIFFSEESEGTNTENMEDSAEQARKLPTGLSSIRASLDERPCSAIPDLRPPDGHNTAEIRQ